MARDQNLRPGSTAGKLATLKPVFGTDHPDATMTAGNSTPLTDGAATVLLASEEWSRAHDLEPLAYLSLYETAAIDHVNGDDGLLMAPRTPYRACWSGAGLTIEDFDLFEIHEAFASQVLATLAAWEKQGLAPVGRDRLNVAGSSLATGHPFAATGARIVATLAKLLAERDAPSRGLISICAAGGQGVTAVLERP
ncbi:hypothetical protein [Streptomyces sp. NPDC058240]|uniref:thiolase family protein n=1 Tax=Streptomyces sp. NPDC058240 TaxID=3346396 RepID=UPI0036ED1432